MLILSRLVFINGGYLMILKKASLLLGLTPLLLSCANSSPVGQYVFQMGKNKDAHISVSLNLTNENYDETNIEKGKKFDLAIDMVTSDVEDEFSNLLKEFTPISGYYTVDKENKVYKETRLRVGLNLLGSVEIPKEITDLIFVASITPTLVNFYIPVSFEDLTFQLYWYGYDLNIAKMLEEESSADPLATPEGAHPIGSHPTQADIDLINQHYSNDHTGVYRDFHVLKLGLTKK